MIRHSHKNHLFFCLLLTVSLSLTGCGTGGNAGERPGADNPPAQTIDWSTHHLAEPQKMQEDSQWYLTEYHDDWITPPGTDYDWVYSIDAAAMDGDIYCQLRYYLGNVADGIREEWNYMDYFDIQTGQGFHVELDPAGWGSQENLRVSDIDIVDDQLAAFLFCDTEDLSYCFLVFYHMAEGVQKTLDLLPVLAEAGISENPRATLDSTGKSIHCDSDGRCYLVWEDGLVVFSDTGKLLCHMDQDADTTLSCLCKTPEGFPIFVGSNRSKRISTYWVYDPAAGEMRSLGETKLMEIQYGCVDSFGNLYYFSDDNIVRWDTRSGNREKIFDGKKNHVFSNTYASKTMAILENGDLAVMDTASDRKGIYVLSPNPPEGTRTLTLVSTAQGDSIVPAAAALFSVRHPGVSIEVSGFTSSGSDDLESYTANLVNRIVAGDAPDMFVISAETMYTLYEKGALADLTDSIPEDTMDQVFGCIWRAGTIDGKLTGLTTDVVASSILVSDEVWSQDVWSLEDVLELAENAPAGALKGLLPRASQYDTLPGLLHWLALRDIDSCLVDRESGTCHFDSDVFRRLLEYCKNTPVLETTPENKFAVTAQAVMDGEYLAYNHDFYFGFSEFCTQMALFPENYHWVGIPTDEGNGNQIIARDFLVVSRDTENMDLIREFLPFLYGDELTRLYPDFCLRRDVLRERVLDADEYHPNKAQFYMGEGTYRILECKPDGTAYTEDYISFMDSCVLRTPMDSAIASIVLDEVEPYFTGDKDMDTVIGIIQNRVQLYLDENAS